jgi:hypothetical protein
VKPAGEARLDALGRPGSSASIAERRTEQIRAQASSFRDPAKPRSGRPGPCCSNLHVSFFERRPRGIRSGDERERKRKVEELVARVRLHEAHPRDRGGGGATPCKSRLDITSI